MGKAYFGITNFRTVKELLISRDDVCFWLYAAHGTQGSILLMWKVHGLSHQAEAAADLHQTITARKGLTSYTVLIN